MIEKIVLCLFGIIIYTYIGVNIYQNLIDKNQLNENISIFFFVMYFILFIILINIIILTICHSKIINKTGFTGPVGFRGDRGIKGVNGECNNNCYKIELKMELINTIEDTYNKLLEDDSNYKGEKIDIRNTIREPKTNKIVDIKLKNNLLNDFVDNIIYSKQYKDSTVQKKDDNSNKTVNQVHSYINSIIKKWIISIYNSLNNVNKHNLDETKNFFLNNYSNSSNTTWKNNKNPFEKIKKYDLYQWGRTRTFKPLTIYVDNNPKNNNYLPQDGKPPLKILHSNHYNFLYQNKTHDTKNQSIKNIIDRYPKNTGSIWKNNNVVKYRNEN